MCQSTQLDRRVGVKPAADGAAATQHTLGRGPTLAIKELEGKARSGGWCGRASRSFDPLADPARDTHRMTAEAGARGEGAVRRYLVVANLTLGGEHLREKVRACRAAGPSRFHIMVPATATRGPHLVGGVGPRRRA